MQSAYKNIGVKMSKKERIKTTLDFLKSSLMTFILLLFGILSYTFVHYEQLNIFKTILVFATLFLNILIIFVILYAVMLNLGRLEKE